MAWKHRKDPLRFFRKTHRRNTNWPGPGYKLGLDLCFWTCGMSRVMWLTRSNRWCLYWNRSNKRSRHWLSFEVHPHLAAARHYVTGSFATNDWTSHVDCGPKAKNRVYF